MLRRVPVETGGGEDEWLSHIAREVGEVGSLPHHGGAGAPDKGGEGGVGAREKG